MGSKLVHRAEQSSWNPRSARSQMQSLQTFRLERPELRFLLGRSLLCHHPIGSQFYIILNGWLVFFFFFFRVSFILFSWP